MTGCEKIRALIMDYIYDEMSEEEARVFELHLERCPLCRAEVESLKKTSGILGEWVEPEPDIRIIAIKERPSFFGRAAELFINGFLSPKRLALGGVGALVIVFLFFSVTNTEISINNGNFSMRMGFMKPVKTEQRGDAPGRTNLAVEELIRENYQLTKALIEQSEARQRQEVIYALSAFKKGLDEERYHDLNLVQYGMRELQKNTYQQVQEIDGALNRLIRPANINSN
jgi:hypothetical protein